MQLYKLDTYVFCNLKDFCSTFHTDKNNLTYFVIKFKSLYQRQRDERHGKLVAFKALLRIDLNSLVKSDARSALSGVVQVHCTIMPGIACYRTTNLI